MIFYFRFIGKYFEMSNIIKLMENLIKINFEDYFVLVIIFLSLLFILVFVLVVGIVKKIFKVYFIKWNIFRCENKDGELFDDN